MKEVRNSGILRAIPLLIAVYFVSLPAQAQYSGGTGEPNDPYQISTADDLMLIENFGSDEHFILTADIDLNPNLPGRKVFGIAVIRYFSGVFDGNGHTVSNLTIIGDYNLGLFGDLGGRAVVKDLGVVDIDITCIGSGGGLVGQMRGGFINHCYSTGTVSGGSFVGGLVGYNGARFSSGKGGLLNNCYSTATVSGVDYVGGLVGYNNSGNITQCYSSGKVTGDDSVGGLIGYNRNGIITNSFWDIETSGQTISDGGTRKTTSEMFDTQTYLNAGWDWIGEVENGISEVWQMSEVGGYPVLAIFSGYMPPQLQGFGTSDDPYLISNALELGAVIYYSPDAHYRLTAPVDLLGISWNTAVIPRFRGTFDGNDLTISHLTITGENYLGLFGRLEPGAKVKNLGLIDTNIAGSGDYVGGIVGLNIGDLIQCYSSGTVSGNDYVGGLVGSNDVFPLWGRGVLTDCYSIVTVSGNRSVGGLAGFSRNSIIHCYSAGLVIGVGEYVGGLVGDMRGGVLQRILFGISKPPARQQATGGLD